MDVQRDNDDDLAVVNAVAYCLSATVPIITADGRRHRLPRQLQFTFRNDVWQQVYASDTSDGWIRANLRVRRRTFDQIVAWLEDFASANNLNVIPAGNAHVDLPMCIAMTMAYLAQEGGFSAVASLFGVSKSDSYPMQQCNDGFAC